jgi:hypothetical protein
VQRAQTAYALGLEVMKDVNGFTKIYEGNEVTGYTRANAQTNFNTLKVEYFVNKPPQAVSRYLFENYAALNEEFQEEDIDFFKVVHRFNDNIWAFEA